MTTTSYEVEETSGDHKEGKNKLNRMKKVTY